MSDIAQTTRTSLRSIGTSARAVDWTVAILSAIALAFAFPRAQQAWLAPLGAAGLFWAWSGPSWKRAFLIGWFAGAIFFAISFSWFTYTVGRYVGSLAWAVVLIPAVVEALAFALSAICYQAALRRGPAWLAPAAGAAAFTVFEWLRSIDTTGLPFAQIGYTQTGTSLGVFAAYVGSFGVTFVVMLLGAYIAYAVLNRRAYALGTVVAALAAAWCACYAYWPARHAAPPNEIVAAVQGNIAQSIKWNSQTLPHSVDRYVSLTKELAPLHPQLVVWPETVITTDLNVNMGTAVTPELQQEIAANRLLNDRFADLARALKTTLVVGSLDVHWSSEGWREYNALYTYSPQGFLFNVYDKRQLVPFTETLPAPALFSWLPYVNLIGHFGHGRDDTVLPAGSLSFAPLICWESAFPDLIHAQLERGAQFLVVATDDAWFGESSGTYQHAQIAQMRAIESGEWVLQSASTGISGIVSPMGVWKEATGLSREDVVAGSIGPPPGSVFARIGPNPVMYAIAALYVLIVAGGALAEKARVKSGKE